MKFRKITAAVSALAVAGTVAIGSSASAQEPPPPTYTEILAAQGGGTDRNWYDYDILAAGIGAAGLNGALDGLEDVTVFIPNDRAFQALAADLFGWRVWFENEAKVLDRIAGLGAETLATVISYHVVLGADNGLPAIDSGTALSVPRGTPLTTLQGGDIRVYPIKRFGTAVLADNDRNDANPFLIRSQLDIQAENGIAHGISRVLRPVDL